MKHLLIAVILFLLGYNCVASTDTTRVFFIGNSFTYTSDVPGLMKGLCDSAKVGFYYQQHTPGGISVGDISQDTFAHWRNRDVFNTLRLGIWDYVVLQDNQGRFVLNYGTFPSPSTSRVIEGHIKIRDSMKHYNACANMILFAGWAVQGALPPYGSTGSALIDRINANYSFLNDSMHQVVSPIGIAWKRAIVALPTVNLWSADSTHESLEGAYLTACVIYSTIFRLNPENIRFTGGVDTAAARQMRIIAWQTVTDSMGNNNLTSITIPLSVSGSVLTATGTYHGYQWFKNDTLIAGATSAAYTTIGASCYRVTGLDSSGCEVRSMPYCFAAATQLAADPTSSVTNVYPNPCENVLHLHTTIADARAVITDISGKVVKEIVLANRETIVPMADVHPGIYIVTVYSGEAVTRERILISKYQQ